MSSRRPVRQLVVAVLLGVLVGGGLMAVTPAGAEVSNAMATSWKKIWKKELKPLADKRYYKKSQTDARYQAKGSYETAGSGYSKAESDAKYAGAGTGYTKAESDTRYAKAPALLKGAWAVSSFTSGAFVLEAPITYGVTLSTAPTAHFIPAGTPPPADCPGTLANPDASPGHLCVYEQSSNGVEARALCNLDSVCGSGVGTFGTEVFATDTAGAADRWMRGTWALRPGGTATVAGRTTSAPTPDVGGGTPIAGVRVRE